MGVDTRRDETFLAGYLCGVDWAKKLGEYGRQEGLCTFFTTTQRQGATKRRKAQRWRVIRLACV